jgi:lipase chaperone LimK
MSGRTLALTLGAAAVAGVIAWGYSQDEPTVAPAPAAALGRAEGFSLMGAAPSPLRSLGPALARSVPDVEHALFVDGSLREASLDGDWGVDAQGGLQPSLALRRRFDQLLTTLGEVNLDELTAWLLDRTLRDVGPQASAEIMAVWARYIALLERPYTTAAQLDDPQSWALALAERQQARREVLGPAWAEAFYRDEDAALRQKMELAGQPGSAGRLPQPSVLHPDPRLSAQELHQRRVAEFGPEAAERLRAEDEAEARWQARLAQARDQVSLLQQAPHLSEPQRREAIDNWIASHFDEREQLRVRALLGL